MANREQNGKAQELLSPVHSLFMGEVLEQQVFPYPEISQEQKEMGQEMINAIQKFAKEHIHSAEFDEKAEIPLEVLAGMAEMGLFGLGVEEVFGGLELSYSLYCRTFSEIAGLDASLAATMGAHQSIGFKALVNQGTAEQKKKWLPKLASGEHFASFCLTEPGSGSDAYSIKTKATLNKDGTYTLNGQKLWITNAGLSEFYTVFCKTEHPEGEKISCFVVEKGTPGLSFGEREKKMGIKASETRAVFFDNVVVPAENLIGGLGKGFKIAMEVLNTGRLSLGAGCVGGMKDVLKLATLHAKNRKQFGKSLAEFGLIQEKLSQMSALTYATESLVYFTTGLMGKGMSDFSLEAAVCKVFGSEAMWKTIDMGMQIAGGNGYMKEYPYERIMRDTRINLIFEGTNEILRCFLALGGVQGPSQKLKELGKLTDISNVLNAPIKSLGLLTDFAKKRVSKAMHTKKLEKIHPRLEKYAEEYMTMVSAFAIEVEGALIKHGKKIVDQELAQKRIADMVIDLYVLMAVFSRTTLVLENKKLSEADAEYYVGLTKITYRNLRQDFQMNLKHMKTNLDNTTQKVSDAVCEREGYGLDVI
ncbi:MAG: acyl-CoA dehydrogenase family protein [Bacteriovoracaceae bacterium]|nr:acyl-CoA dehydrogenase family protein [Bacteriovoracaceae bacterium]